MPDERFLCPAGRTCHFSKTGPGPGRYGLRCRPGAGAPGFRQPVLRRGLRPDGGTVSLPHLRSSLLRHRVRHRRRAHRHGRGSAASGVFRSPPGCPFHRHQLPRGEAGGPGANGAGGRPSGKAQRHSGSGILQGHPGAGESPHPLPHPPPRGLSRRKSGPGEPLRHRPALGDPRRTALGKLSAPKGGGMPERFPCPQSGCRRAGGALPAADHAGGRL